MSELKDSATKTPLVVGWFLLAVSLPLGLTLEALHAMKVQVYLGSAMRREMWTLAHAHGNLLGLLLIVFALAAPRFLPDESRRRRIGRTNALGAVLMPLGFFLGGVLNHEGDPSLAVVLVPAGGLLLLVGLLASGFAAGKE